jgi:nucleoredoxin
VLRIVPPNGLRIGQFNLRVEREAIMTTFLGRALGAVLALGAGAALAAPPEKLGPRELANRPDRWPAQVTMLRDMDFGGAKLAKGQKVTVLEYTGGNEVGVDAGNNQLFAIETTDCDLMDAANAAWAKLTAEQRALEPATLVEDASLWPTKVKCTAAFTLNNGKELPPGAEYDLLTIDRGGQVQLYTRDGDARLTAQLAQTDAVARARELAAVDKSKRPGRIAEALKGAALVDASGKPMKRDDLDRQQVFALYYGASWCGPCRTFSPGFVKYVNSVAAANPNLTVVLCSNDENDADMLKYMREEKMPWAAVPLKSLKQSPLLWTYLRGSIPQLTIVDRHGKVIADSWSGNTYVGPKQALAGLDRAVKSGAAK